MTTVLVLGAGGSAAANFCDALDRSGRGYHLVGADASPVHLHLAPTATRELLPPAGDPAHRGAVQHLVKHHGVDVVHAQPDGEVLELGAMREDLPAATLLPPNSVLALARDKSATTSLLRACDVPVPDAAPFTAVDGVRPVVEGLLADHDSVWVRARVGAGSRAALPVRSADQAEAWVRWWIDERGARVADFMASEQLPGREFAYQSLWCHGALVAGQARERVEYLYGHLTPSGQTSTPAVARTVAEPAVDETACAAVRAIDPEPHGVYCVDLKEDAAGVARVTEINAGRFFTTSNFFAAAGLNMPDLYVRCALGERPASLGSSPLPPDLYWIRMVDMGYRLVPGEELHAWTPAGR